MAMRNAEIKEKIEDIEQRIRIAKYADYLSDDDWRWIKDREAEIEELRVMLK